MANDESIPHPLGAVTLGAASPPELRIDGQCVTKTLPRIALSADAVDKIREQSETLLSAVVATYDAEVAAGEVGALGSGMTSTISPASAGNEFGPTGLLYGRIQSGKTAAMIAFTSMAFDNGFRVIVVLTSNFVELVKQTAERFQAVARALVHASTERDTWESDVDNIKKHVGTRGLVVICAKDARHLDSVRQLLEQCDAVRYPAIVLDDEADQASLDANTRKRSVSDNPNEVAPTKIHELIANLRRVLRHHIFVQVTATPFALFLQNVSSPLRPRFTRLLDPGDGYTGGEHFFSESHLGTDDGANPTPPIIYVDEKESDELGQDAALPPLGLERAISFFLVASSAQVIADPEILRVSQNFLCHTSHRKADHDRLAKLTKDFLSRFEDDLVAGAPRALGLLNWGYEELRRTFAAPPSLEEIIGDIVDRLPRRRVRIVNSEGKGAAELVGSPNFIIGGNIVGRGLTISNLLVTYYLRRPMTSQMDTMLQHARMFGYRERLMPFTRVFLPRSLAVRFHSIHRSERELRELLLTADPRKPIPVQVVGELRATRYGVLDTGSVVAIGRGSHVFPNSPPVGLAAKKRKRVEEIFRDVFDQGFEQLTNPKSNHLHQDVPVDLVCELCELFENDEWDGSSIGSILKATTPRAWLRFRPMDRKRKAGQGSELLTGALSGEELSNARAASQPSFFLFRQVTAQPAWQNELFWYPTVVFSGSMNSIVYNSTKE